ncbi:exopolysaccharide biosynthesis protein [Starkeya sp. ORNL1]|uniref:polysaccharide biosynthesis/export family protein n=1 Tax=Starkeya sp. ORNL1 TaxID=2709380 RepID=UPI0014645C29|nr:polysaccharide biosynthesis/export family protein [Starkeya sp. ORNL1]QJP14838.1 exopolysaccharide biosynthesis protein [Starkeya sp. ORNL1]
MMRRYMRGGRTGALLAAIGLALLSATVPCRAEYLLSPGDVIEITVAGMPDLKQRAPIQLDGTITLPMVGSIVAAGSTSTDVQARAEMALASKVIRQTTPDGRDRIVLIQPGDVAVAVVEYRPIYVNGDVFQPGQHPYRPQMTVRHAIALSGGVSTVRGRSATMGVEVVEVDREYRTTVLALAKEHVHAWRLTAELEGSEDIKEQRLVDAPIPAATLSEYLRIESSYLNIRLLEYRNEKVHLQNAARLAGEQIETLTTQEKQEAQGLQSDIDELDRINKLYSSGSLISPRVTEARRALLLSSTRRLQTTATLSQVKQQREELLFRLEKLDTQRRLEVLRDMNESQARAAELRTRLEAAAQKLQVFGRIIAADATSTGARPEITIIRRSGEGWDRLSVSEDADLLPGDAIEVVARPDLLETAAGQ